MYKDEIWRPIKGYENQFEISNYGRVKRLQRTTLLKNDTRRTYKEEIRDNYHIGEIGYPTTSLNQKHFLVHRLVAEAFLPNPKQKKYVNHINGNKENYHLNNLEWCTSQENAIHAFNNGLVSSIRKRPQSILELKDLEDEIWNDVEGYEEIYKVSNFGRVKALVKYVGKREQLFPERIMKQPLRGGYHFVSLTRNDKSKKYSIHRLVAQAFLPNPEGKKYVNHINGVKTDNFAINLEWSTLQENAKHTYESGLSVKVKAVKQYDLEGNFISDYSSIAEAGRENNMNPSGIQRACSIKAISGMYQWRYSDGVQDVLDLLKIENWKPYMKTQQFKEIQQFSLEGKYIRAFDNIKNALKYLTQNGFENANGEGLRRALSKKGYYAYESQWRFVGDSTPVENIDKNNIKRPVLQFSNEGELLGRFESASEAGRELGYPDGGNIRYCCSGKIKTAYNYIWLNEDEYEVDNNILLNRISNIEKEPILQFTKEGEFLERYSSIQEAVQFVLKRHPRRKRADLIIRCCKHILKSAYGYIWLFEKEYHHNKNIINSKIGEVTKKVIQFSRDGKMIRKYNSGSEAELYLKRTKGVKSASSAISLCCSGKIKSAYGYIWMHEAEYVRNPNSIERYLIKKKVVLQFTRSGELLEKFKSIDDAVEFLNKTKNIKASSGGITKCCRGINKTSFCYIWLYEEEFIRDSGVLLLKVKHKS